MVRAFLVIILAISGFALSYQIMKWRDELVYIEDFRDISPRQYWRFILGILVTCGTALLVICLKFPDTKWGDQAFMAASIGALPGMLAGGVWQLIAHEPLSRYLRRGVIIIGLSSFVLLALGLVSDGIPRLLQQQLSFDQLKVVKSLSTGGIWKVDFTFQQGKSISITDAEQIKLLEEILADAILSRQFDNSDLNKMSMKIYSDNETFVYHTFFVARYPDDLVLQFPTSKTDRGICLSGLKHWLDENVLNGQK